MGIFGSEKKEHNDESDTESQEVVNQENFNFNDVLICSTHGKVYAIHKRNGDRLWRAEFPSGRLTGGGVLSLFVTDYDKLIVGGNGRTVCLNIMTGDTLWVNKMEGFGINEVSVLSTPSRFLSPNKHPVSSANHDSPPHYHDDGNLSDKPIVVGSSRGKVMGIDSESGEQIWKYSCSGSWYSMPVAIVEPPSLEDGRIDQLVYIGAGKSVHCLKASTGDVVWTCRVSNAKLGSNHMTLATPWSSRLAAEAYSAFSQNPTAQAAIRQREEASSGGG